MSERVDVAIVGGGYSGTVLAIHLARQMEPGAIIAIIEPRAELGAGLAYSAPEDDHKINVPAANMGVSSLPEDRFIHWLESRHPETLDDGGHSYVARHWFGAFVRDRLTETIARTGVEIRHLRAKAVDARRGDSGTGIFLADGSLVQAGSVAVAVSHGLPATLGSLSAEICDAPKFIGDPWRSDRLAGIAPDDHVLVIGTGLTMADVVVSLLGRGHCGRITAFSRHGLMPRCNGSGVVPPGLDFTSWQVTPLSIFLRTIRAEIRQAERAGGSWRDVFTALREQSGAIWSNLPVQEKRRFMRHLKSYYDAHRYRMAPEIARRIEAARRDGRVEILAARLRRVRAEPLGFSAELRHRCSGTLETREVSAIVNCTGPKHELCADPNHFLGALIGRGLAHADPFGLGLAVDSDLRLTGLCQNLYALGPLTRGRFGDVMGVPEIMAQAQRLAHIIVSAS